MPSTAFFQLPTVLYAGVGRRTGRGDLPCPILGGFDSKSKRRVWEDHFGGRLGRRLTVGGRRRTFGDVATAARSLSSRSGGGRSFAGPRRWSGSKKKTPRGSVGGRRRCGSRLKMTSARKMAKSGDPGAPNEPILGVRI